MRLVHRRRGRRRQSGDTGERPLPDAKGLGTHAPAAVRYYLGGRCASFTADVGVDD
ncbi:NPCBM/NEW2 domain-containing protein, partial [Streptomyces coeruleoprunus]|uniref:NPCBM/NEW2 domain-containing protein n=1 Tax=Streptomyces coeruleoprunus TaxID=285563 RepID=UPI0035EDD7E7